MRRSRAVVVALALVAGLCGLPSSASAGGHPHFNDQGTLTWYTSLAEAQAVARSTGKLIFVDSGRLECGNCRQLIERILPVEPVRSRIAAIAIGLSDDCDEPDATVSALLTSNLPSARMLPLVGFLTPELRWVTGWSGGTTSNEVMRALDVAEARYQRVQEVLRQRSAPRCDVPGDEAAGRRRGAGERRSQGFGARRSVDAESRAVRDARAPAVAPPPAPPAAGPAPPPAPPPPAPLPPAPPAPAPLPPAPPPRAAPARAPASGAAGGADPRAHARRTEDRAAAAPRGEAPPDAGPAGGPRARRGAHALAGAPPHESRVGDRRDRRRPARPRTPGTGAACSSSRTRPASRSPRPTRRR